MTPVEDIASTRDEIAKLDDEIRTARDKGDGDRQRELEKRRTEVLQRLGDQRTKLLSGSPDPFTLVDGRFPLLLLPVRLETRFAWQDEKDPKVRTFARPPGNAVPLLLVRIYPDDIHVDGFDPALTPDEVEWRRKFLKACEAGTDQPDFVAAWADLVQRAGPRRAAWIAHSARRPSVPTAADHWGRAPRAACLPDRWVATAWTAGQQVGAVGRPVQEPLDVAPDPARADPATGGLAWTTSFDTALDAGMALVVPLPVTFAAAAPVDRLVVVGAVATRDPDGSTAAFEALLDAHHYTGGLSFVRPGAATNSLVGDRVDRTTRPTPEQVFRVEGDMVPLQPPRTLTDAPNSDGAEAERLLGLTPGAFGHVEGADGLRIEAGRDIRHLLATAARGTLERLLSPALAPDDLDQATGFLVGAVDGLGPLPVLRVGDQPYGVLPVALVQADDYELDPFEKRLWGLLDALRREVWEPAATGSPRIGGPAADPTTTLLALLRSDGVARQVGFRPALGPRARAAVTNTLDRRRLRGLITARTNLADLVARLGGPPDLGLAGMALLDAAAPLTSPLVQAADAAPGDTAHDHLELLAFRPPASSFRLPDLVHEAYPGAPPDTFLFALARLALLASADRAVRSILLGAQPPAIDPDTVTAWDDELDRTSAGSTPWYPLADRLYAPTPYDPLLPMHWALLGPTPPFEAWPFLETLGTVRRLACAPDPTTTGCTPHDPGVLDVVLRSELGLLSHRLDAWITALATQRLRRLRSTPEQERGLVIGGYGVLLDIAPVALGKPLGPAELPAKERGPVFTDAGNAGYVHAPSVAHAATAAVLRSAHLGQWETAPAGDPARDAFAVDLSSRRVRNALGLLDGIREGQPLGALLGYRIERRLRDEAPEGIAAVRAVAPLVADRLTVGGPVEQVAAGNVVDAVRLVDLVGEPTPVGVENVVGPQLAGLPADRRQAVVAATVDALVEAVDALDAVADLLTAEGVFQLVRGNPARSAAAGDAISATGNPPPEPEVVTSARGGVAVTQRVAVAVPADATVPTDETGGWALTPRGALEPALERWARAHLPSPDAVEVAWAGTPDGAVAAGTATLAVLQGAASAAGRTRLRLGALDLVAGAGAAGRPGLETRLLAMARLVDPADPGAGSDPDALPAAVVPTQALLAALEAADGLRALLADSRPLLPADLVPPGPWRTATAWSARWPPPRPPCWPRSPPAPVHRPCSTPCSTPTASGSTRPHPSPRSAAPTPTTFPSAT